MWISSLFCTVLSSYNFYYKRIPVYQNAKNLVTQSNQGSSRFEVFTTMILNDSGLLDCYTVPSSDFDSPRLINPESEYPVIPSKFRNYLPTYTAFHPGRLESSSNIIQLYFWFRRQHILFSLTLFSFFRYTILLVIEHSGLVSCVGRGEIMGQKMTLCPVLHISKASFSLP